MLTNQVLCRGRKRGRNDYRRASWRARTCIVGAAVFCAFPALTAEGQQSWGGMAAKRGQLVEVIVGDHGSIRLQSSPCAGVTVVAKTVTPQWASPVVASPGSQMLGFLTMADGREAFVVPDVGWTRWALQLSPAYLSAVCAVAAGADEPTDVLRTAWRDLLAKLDQRARDEASRLAFEFHVWAADLSEGELTAIVQQISIFPVGEAEALRWTVFFRQVPPGPTLLALLRVAETSGKPFFRTFLQTYKQLMVGDATFIAFCANRPVAERPEACPPLPEMRP